MSLQKFSVIGLCLGATLVGCGKAQEAPPPSREIWPNGTAQIAFTQYGLTDTYFYGRTGDKYGVVCKGEKDHIQIRFVESLPKRQMGEEQLVIVGQHPKGPDSKGSDLPAATFKLKNWPPNGKTRKSDTYEQSIGNAPCKLNYKKAGHRGVGTFDCEGLSSMERFAQTLREHPTDTAFAPAPIRIRGEFNCYVFENEDEPTHELSLPPKDPRYRDRNFGQDGRAF